MQGVSSKHPPGAVCFISGELTRYGLSMQCLQSLMVPVGSALHWNMGVLIANSLNSAFAAVMANPALEWAFVMGDDHTYAPDIILRLLEHEADIVLPFCLNRMPPLDPVIVERDKQRMKPLKDMPLSGLYQLKDNETCGDAGMLLRRHVLADAGPPWYERIKSGAIASEDQEFAQKLKNLGYKIHVDVDTPIGHIGAVDYAPVRKGDQWEVRMVAGNKHIADLKWGSE